MSENGKPYIKKKHIICFAVLLISINAYLLYWFHTNSSSVNNDAIVPYDPVIQELFTIAAGYSEDNIDKRVEAAETLTKCNDAEIWNNLLLMDTHINFKRYGHEDVDKESFEILQDSLQPFELAVKAAVIRSLPKKPRDSTLWALTFLLEEEGHGRWFREEGFILKIHADYGSPPIREMARDCLKDSLGIDCEWDISAWRKAILNQKGLKNNDTGDGE